MYHAVLYAPPVVDLWLCVLIYYEQTVYYVATAIHML